MKRFFITLFVLLCFVEIRAGTRISTAADFMARVRKAVNISNTTGLPDSVLLDLSDRALLWVSTNVGGIETQFAIVTVANQAFYAVPDSLVEITYASIVSWGQTKSAVSWTPQFYDERFKAGKLEGTGVDDVPSAFNFWSDTIQLMPVPTKADTIYFKGYLEHPAVDSSVDAVRLKPAYIEAAVTYATELVWEFLGEYDQAGIYAVKFKEQSAGLTTTYTRKIDLYQGAK
jgi:hypothetical protein